jgi:D-serine deaminase-like pyridoxal phosphate-dependent protein
MPDNAIATPAVIVDRPRLEANLARVQAIANARGVGLRPHIKTHKCLEIARLQRAGGAVGFTCSKAEEAQVFITDGAPSVTVAYPMVEPERPARLMALARERGGALRFIVDAEAGVEAIGAAAKRERFQAGVFIKVDVGLHRVGLKEDDPRLVPLAKRIVATDGLAFQGLLAHAGHAYGAGNAAGVRGVAREEAAIMGRVKRRLEDTGLTVPEVSVGSTPTALASDAYDGITEMRPGNYVFLDMTPVRLGLAELDDVALHVLATIVSLNDDMAIIDAGSKVLSSDLGAHGSGAGGFGVAFPAEGPPRADDGMPVARLSEEHGLVRHGGRRLRVGERLRVVPNHSCPVANLADELVVVAPGAAPEIWRVAARGKVR